MLKIGGQRELPQAPTEFKDAVELYARESGRHGILQFVPTEFWNGEIVNGTWRARFTLRDSDKRLSISQEGRGEAPTEDVWFHVLNPKEGELIPAGHGRREREYRPVSLQELGVAGMVTWLERGNMWSGRGEYQSLEEQAKRAMEANNEMRLKHRADEKEQSRWEQRDKRRWRFKIPFLPIGIDLREKHEGANEGS